MERVTKYRVIMTVETLDDRSEIEKRFKNIVSNTKKFNRGLIKTKTRKVANGTIVEFRNKSNDKLCRAINLVTDRYTTELSYQDYQ